MFALTESGLFRLLFTAYPDPPEGKDAAGEDPYSLLNAALGDLVAVGYLTGQGRAGAEVTCWSAVHALAVLNIDGRLCGLSSSDRDAALTVCSSGSTAGSGSAATRPSLADS
ncbi:TetR-like C-terminal domain-containing protein [Nocardioides mesophilus]|uniref:TetR-like C-terminal domain-containing protein n=1 Tax=Nocardioides mesophilus TaxID=433659 RepID=UPI001CB6C120|nr:TetR-like C-terminal domain-containing protein [Nocardioides mesophilus]